MELPQRAERVLSVTAGIVLAVGAVAIAEPAFATVSNCTMTANTPMAVKSGSKTYIHWMASATCPAATSRTYAVSLYHVYDVFPDAQAAHVAYSGSYKKYAVDELSCDNGGTTTYQTYSELYDSQTKVAYSSTKTFAHC